MTDTIVSNHGDQRALLEPNRQRSDAEPQQAFHEALLPASEELAPAPAPDPIPVGRRRWMVAIITLQAALIFSDQQVLAPHLTQVAEDLGLDEEQKDTYLGGYMMAAFFCVGAPAALLVGWLADRMNRVHLLFAVVLMGQGPCLGTYWVTHFWQLFILRTLTGISVGGVFPLTFSMLGDLYPITQRAGVSAVVQIATGAGIAAGQALSGMTGTTNWRIPFLVISAPSLLSACVLLATMKDPQRGAYEEALRGAYAEGGSGYSETITWAKARRLLHVPSNLLVVAQGLPGSLPWGMMMTYFNDYLSQQKGFSVQVATVVVLVFGIGGAIGVIGGGYVGQKLYNRRKEHMAWLMGACVLVGCGPMFYLINAPLDSIPVVLTCGVALFGGAVASVAGPNLRAVLLNVNEPETRGVAFALQSMTDDLGKGLGPFIVAGFIHWLGRRGAFNVAAAGWLPCAALLTLLVRYMRKDEADMQHRLAAKVEFALAEQEAQDRGFEVPPRLTSNGGVRGTSSAGALPLSNGVHAVAPDDTRLIIHNDSHLAPQEPPPPPPQQPTMAAPLPSRPASAADGWEHQASLAASALPPGCIPSDSASAAHLHPAPSGTSMLNS